MFVELEDVRNSENNLVILPGKLLVSELVVYWKKPSKFLAYDSVSKPANNKAF